LIISVWQWALAFFRSYYHLPESRSDFSATFTTMAFGHSSLRWFEINT
jgi:hypothetical protein